MTDVKKGQAVPRGALVRIEYQRQAGNYRWSLYEMTAVYLWTEGDTVSFSLRPLAGTTQLSKRWHPITKVEIIKTANQVQAMGGLRDRSLEKFVKRPNRLRALEANEIIAE